MATSAQVPLPPLRHLLANHHSHLQLLCTHQLRRPIHRHRSHPPHPPAKLQLRPGASRLLELPNTGLLLQRGQHQHQYHPSLPDDQSRRWVISGLTEAKLHHRFILCCDGEHPRGDQWMYSLLHLGFKCLNISQDINITQGLRVRSENFTQRSALGNIPKL